MKDSLITALFKEVPPFVLSHVERARFTSYQPENIVVYLITECA